MKYRTVTHEFVEKIPDTLENGKIYISIPFATAVHKCFCGCNREVVTPLSPTDWKLMYDGETVSLTPSVGNWSFPCKSHYWIRNNKVLSARKWSSEEIYVAQKEERAEKDTYFNKKHESQNHKPWSKWFNF